MALTKKLALGLQGLGDEPDGSATFGNIMVANPADFLPGEYQGPSMNAASPEAQANQNALYAAQQSALASGVGIPQFPTQSTMVPITSSGTGSTMIIALVLLAAGFVFIETMGKR